MIKDELVTYKTAKLAKQKGFNIPTFNVFDEELDLIKPISIFTLKNGKYSDKKLVDWNSIEKELKTDYELYSAPTQSLLQKWLRDVHGTIIYVVPFKDIGDDNNDPIRFKVFTTKTINSKEYKTYEEALEIGLQEALNLLPDVEL